MRNNIRKAGEKVVNGEEMTEKERTDAQLATLYNLRLQIKESDKETYSKDEILELLDIVAQEKSCK